MKKELPKFNFNDLAESMKDGVAFAQGKITARTFTAERPRAEMAPKDITAIRDQLNVSQAVFARMLNVSKATAVSWERGHRRPSGAAVRLLQIARKEPRVLTGVK
jgi:putative transcriptional regulator